MTITRPTLEFNGVILYVSESVVSKVLGEPVESIVYDSYPNEVEVGYKFRNKKGVDLILVGNGNFFALYGETKLKDITSARDLIVELNRAEGKSDYAFSVELDGNVVKYRN